jgi:long-chain acyl-CoA synthetase
MSAAAAPIAPATPTLADVIRNAARHPGIATRVRRGGGWEETSFEQLAATALEIAGGLIGLGVRPGDRVAILGSTRPEWTFADCGALCAGATVVPVYHTNSPEECLYVLAHSQARVLICEDALQLGKIEQVRSELPMLQHVFTMVPALRTGSLEDLRALGAREGEPRFADVDPGAVATIVYTSGTTGPPKGCELTHANLLATIRMYEEQLELGPDAVFFMFLPLAHSLARMVQMVALDTGATLAFWQGNPKVLLEDIAEARPTHLPSVPRVFEKIHTRALAAAEESSAPRRRAFRWALAAGARARRAEHAGPLLRAQHRLADRLVLARVRGLFGGDLRLGLTGAAPIARDVLEFFDACGTLVLEGYGMTETSAAATLNTPEAYRFGTVGRPLPGSEIAIASDGEVLMRGPHVFAGYHRDEDATRETFNGNWLRSGDLGAIDPDGFLTITGRKKDLIITSSGKNITPSNIEAALRESRWIADAVVYGDERPYLVALLTLDPDEIEALATAGGPPAHSDPRVLAAVQAAVDATNDRFARIEQIKRFAVLDHDFTQAGGELTPTLKVKRAAVYERYRSEINALYSPE